MGGYESGRWGWHWKKTTVEECLQLDMAQLNREGMLSWDLRWLGTWRWTYADGATCSISLEVDTTDRARPWVRLFYTDKRKGQDVDYRVMLQTTRPYFGGWRWWFTCPLVVNGQPCKRRVRKLYLPPGGLYFGCRHCYDLTYTSCQESDKRVSALSRVFEDDPDALLDAIERGGADLILALKAMDKMGLWRW